MKRILVPARDNDMLQEIARPKLRGRRKALQKDIEINGLCPQVANRVIFMDKAEIVEDAAADAFLGAPRSMRGHHGRAAPSAD